MGIKFYDKFSASFMHVQLVRFGSMVKISLSTVGYLLGVFFRLWIP